MANVLQTLTTHTQENKTYYERVLLERLLPNLLFYRFAQKRSIPNNEGDTINFRRFNSLGAATTALSEGAPGDGTTLNITALTATLAQYGSYVTISDKLAKMGIDKVMTETAELLGEQAALTIDSLIAAVVSAGTNVLYAGTATADTAVTASDVLTGTLVKKAVRTLRSGNAKPFEDGYFAAVVDPAVAYDLMSDSLWQDVSKYNGGEEIKKGELGRLHGVKFFESTNAPTGTGTNSLVLHKTCIFGRDAFGAVDLEAQGAGKPSIIVKDFGSAGSSDPLDQKASAGWKCAFVAKRLQEASLIRVVTAASA